MSLLGSIFGDSKKEKEKDGGNHLSGLFEKSAALPETPHHVPVARPRPTKRKKENEEDQKPKKQRKPKKKEEETSKSETEKESNEDDAAAKDSSKEAGKEDDQEEESSDKKEDDEERTIFVGNLPLATTTRKSMATLFKDCGPVASTRIRSVPVKGIKLPPARAGDQSLMKKVCVNTKEIDDSLKNTVQGYVVFKNIESVAKAL
jgi:nucleolar protein 12